jgi:hypothetical protein
MWERGPSATRRRRGRRQRWSGAVWEASASGDGELRSADDLTRRSGDWINRIGRLTRVAAPGGVDVDLPGGGVDEGSGRLRGSEPNWIPCRKNRLRIIVGCIALCLSVGIYRVQES